MKTEDEITTRWRELVKQNRRRRLDRLAVGRVNRVHADFVRSLGGRLRPDGTVRFGRDALVQWHERGVDTQAIQNRPLVEVLGVLGGVGEADRSSGPPKKGLPKNAPTVAQGGDA